MSILEEINSSNDIKKLSYDQINTLCKETRQFLIDTISKTGGHLASNLGTVELIYALHRVYDTARDRLVFDVGHQSYTHKIITGRRDEFSTLRQYGGVSGFPKPHESEDDSFIAGHASNSVSVALGMAKARSLMNEDYEVVALIGDGALTGGLAYEGLAAAAASKEPMVIILNDNNMSIDTNVGGTAHMLQRMRVKPGYISFKRWYRSVFSLTPRLYKFNHAVKEWLKARLLPENIFSGLGLSYLGPVDGHDVAKLETVIRWAKEMRETVIVHVITTKGKGCTYAEEHPERYHGVGPFDPVTGVVAQSGAGFSEMFGKYLCDFAQEDGRIMAVTAAMAGGTGLDCFARQYPERFIDAGIAEGHATAMAAGIAKQGALPVFAVYSSFLQRGFDMLIHDVSLQNLHVVFGVDRAGIVGSDGETHHGIFDLSYLSSVPGMKILCPASFAELRSMLHAAIFDLDGPVAIRYPRGGEGAYRQNSALEECLLREGSDITIACYGSFVNEALLAAQKLAEKGISAELVKIPMIFPGSYELCLKSISKTAKLLALEEVCSAGCLGEKLLAEALENNIKVNKSRLMNLGDGIIAHGDRDLLLRDAGLGLDSIVSAAERMCSE